MPPPKKREKDAMLIKDSIMNGGGTVAVGTTMGIVGDATKLNPHQQEQELFLQAFEKPTQIYRFLRNRQAASPIFLNRTLSYMKDRMSRNNKLRSSFKIDSMLIRAEKTKFQQQIFFNIIYHGIFDKSGIGDQWWNSGDVVYLETTLYKITKNKRKDSTSEFQQLLKNTANVIYNPTKNLCKFSTFSIPKQIMQPLGDQHTIYKVLFRVETISRFKTLTEINKGDEETSKHGEINSKIYGCELIVFDRSTGVMLEGDYQAALQEISPYSIKSFSPRGRTWKALPNNYIPMSSQYEHFNNMPMIKFRWTWSDFEIPSVIEDYNKYGSFKGRIPKGVFNRNLVKRNGTDDLQINHNNNCLKNENTCNKPFTKAEKIQIVYNFLYSNNTRQQTEYTQEVICPWCSLDCLRLYALLKHLKLCHARFNFTYQPAGNGARIDVTINDSYDGSYAGSPYDLAGSAGCSFARTSGPVRRTSVTNLLVCRPRRQKTCLDEFLVLDDDELSNQRSYITGHNRLYHHTETCLPVHPKELDFDSEGECDPQWLRQKTVQMLDEFSDVNEGEKELMKLWNLHVMKHGYVGDCQLPLACEMFLDANGEEIVLKNLYRNFILHVGSLFDYGLISAEVLFKTVKKLQGMISKYKKGQDTLLRQRATQLKYWLEVGMHKQDEQKLKTPQKPITTLTNVQEIGVFLTNETNELDNTLQLSKRPLSTVKRTNLLPHGGLMNGAMRNVAKKSATSEMDRNKRPVNGVGKKSAAIASVIVANTTDGHNTKLKVRDVDDKAQTVKRKLVSKADKEEGKYGNCNDGIDVDMLQICTRHETTVMPTTASVVENQKATSAFTYIHEF